MYLFVYLEQPPDVDGTITFDSIREFSTFFYEKLRLDKWSAAHEFSRALRDFFSTATSGPREGPYASGMCSRDTLDSFSDRKNMGAFYT